jgi:phospholipase C
VAGSSFVRRFAGRIETGADGISDPAMGGPARLEQD